MTYKKKTIKDLCDEIFALHYHVPKCPKHKTYCEIAISTSKRYPKTYGFYCNKCQDEWVRAFEKAGGPVKRARNND